MNNLGIVFHKKKFFNDRRKKIERSIMNNFVNFFKNIFSILPEQNYVGLSRINSINVSVKTIKKSNKKSEPTLSELMRKGHKKLKVKS
jgi:hypothetical protein